MKLSICIPVMGQLEDTKGVWGCHLNNIDDKANTELLVIDNNSQDDTVPFLERFIFPQFPDHKLVHNFENLGVVRSMNQCVSESKGDVIAILHNDLYVFEDGWNLRVMEAFENNPKLGLAGFLGAQGLHEGGGRMNTMSNMMEAEIHGERVTHNRRISHFDGMALIGRRAMFEQVGGFDEGVTFHHFYDRIMSIQSHINGWENWLIPVSCHHRSGVTANRSDYQTWIDQKMGTQGFTGDLASYKASEKYFLEKYGKYLPIWIP